VKKGNSYRVLTALAAKTGRSKAFYIREAILAYIDDLEDAYLAEKIVDRVRKSEERTYTLTEKVYKK